LPPLLALALTSLLLTGCSSHKKSEAPTRSRPKSFQIALEAEPDHPCRQLVNTRFRVRVRDMAGKPVEGAKVFLDLTMPDMPMPPNSGYAEASGNPGEYVWKNAVFTMGGKWQVEVKVTQGQKEDSAKYLMDVQ